MFGRCLEPSDVAGEPLVGLNPSIILHIDDACLVYYPVRCQFKVLVVRVLQVNQLRVGLVYIDVVLDELDALSYIRGYSRKVLHYHLNIYIP